MVPPAKPAASPLRIPAGSFSHKARPLAFKALLMKPSAANHKEAKVGPKAERHAHPHPQPRDPQDEQKPKDRPAKEVDPLDPAARLSAQLAPPMASSMPAITKTEEVTQRSRVSLEELIPQVVRRIAWGGDRTKGAVQIELTSGDRVTLHAEGRRVRIEVDGNDALEKKIESRLRAAGIEVEGVR